MHQSLLSGEDIVTNINEAYSHKAKEVTPSTYARNVANAFGYTEEKLRSIPDGALICLSCGNPIAMASLKRKRDMISRARNNARRQNLKPPHVAFVQAALTDDLPIISDAIDAAVSEEAYCALRPTGRIVLDDIIAKKALPENIRTDISAYVGSIASAVEEAQYRRLLQDAGFKDVLFVDTKNDLNVYYNASTGAERSNASCCAPPSVNSPPAFAVNVWVAWYQICAVKDETPAHAVEQRETALQSPWSAYPTPQSSVVTMSPDEVALLMRDPSKKVVDYAIIDVKRHDHAGEHVRGSHQCHAQTFYDDLPTFFAEFKTTERVIFYCGSSNGRGPRCAGWYQDYLHENGTNTSAAYVLKGGVKGWLVNFGEQADLIDSDKV